VVQVTDGDGNIVSASTTFFVIYGNTGIRGNVLERISKNLINGKAYILLILYYRL
jgi:hypothetical protein